MYHNNMDDLNEENGESDLYSCRLTRQVSMHTLIGFNELRLNVQLCDATLILDNGKQFPIHRSVLSGASDYFRTLFTCTSHKEEITTISLKMIESSTMETILQYIYLRQVDINYESAFEIIRTADYLVISSLVELCQEFLIECLKPNNCVTLLQFANYYDFCLVIEMANKFIAKYFMTIAEEGDQLMELEKEEFKKIIENDQLNVKREELVWDVILKWIDYQPERKKFDLLFLMPAVRFGLMDPKYFIDNVKDHGYIKNRPECKPYVMETLKYVNDLKLPSKKAYSITPMIARPRYPFEVLFAIGGWSGGRTISIFETYDVKTDRWLQILKEDPLGSRAYHSMVAVDHEIYVIGGINATELLSSCKKFNTITKLWEEIAPMNSVRCYLSVVLLNGMIYAMGGYDGVRRLNSAERYDIKRNQWSMIASMTYERSDAGAAVLNDRIYVAGGFDGSRCLNTAEAYDAAADRWTPVAAMRTRRTGVSCAPYRGSVYAVGGFNGLTRMRSGEAYDPAADRWSPVPEMAWPRSNFALCVLDETMYALGGFDGVQPTARVECYDGRTDKWCMKRNMQVPRSALAACVISDFENVESYVVPWYRMCEEKSQNIDRRQYANNIVSGDISEAQERP